MQIAVRGGRRAEGEVVLQGSKNAALPMLAASILTSDEMIFRHCPDISDVRVMAELLENLGLQTAWEDSVFRVQADVLNIVQYYRKKPVAFGLRFFFWEACWQEPEKPKYTCREGVPSADGRLTSISKHWNNPA